MQPQLKVEIEACPPWLAAVIATALTSPVRFALIVWKGVSVGELTVKDTSGDLNAAVTFLDAEGHETAPDNVPAWTSSDETVATVTPSEDGLAATVAVGGPGVALIEVRVTETNEETQESYEIVAQGTLTVQPGDAVIGDVSFTSS